MTTTLPQAPRMGDTRRLKVLLDNGGDVNSRDQEVRTPMHEAAWTSRDESADLLRARGGRGDAGFTPRGARACAPYEVFRAIAAKVKELGLQPYRPPEPPPPIDEEQIKLICWMGVEAMG